MRTIGPLLDPPNGRLACFFWGSDGCSCLQMKQTYGWVTVVPSWPPPPQQKSCRAPSKHLLWGFCFKCHFGSNIRNDLWVGSLKALLMKRRFRGSEVLLPTFRSNIRNAFGFFRAGLNGGSNKSVQKGSLPGGWLGWRSRTRLRWNPTGLEGCDHGEDACCMATVHPLTLPGQCTADHS